MNFLENVDRKQLQKILLVVISVLTLAALVLLLTIIISSINPQSPTGADFDFKTVTVTEKDLSTGTLLIVNPEVKYDIPSEEDLGLILVSDYRKEHSTDTPYYVSGLTTTKLNLTAMESLHNMLLKMAEDTGDSDAMVKTGFRSYEDQANKQIAQGHSDHHTGMLVALTKFEGDLSTAQVAWLEENAHKYGFVQRYPEDKKGTTLVSDYTYAFHYVGVAHATYMKENSLCLEEYVSLLKKDHSDGKEMLEITGADGANYAVYYVECRSGDKINVPKDSNNTYTVSGTNNGGVVVTVKLAK